MRMRAKKRTAKKSAKEKTNHSKFGMVQKWMQPITPFVRVGFKDYGTKTGGYKAAVSFALKDAVEGVYPNQYVNPEIVQVSGGDLYVSAAAEVALDESYNLQFTWDTADGDNGMPQDQVMLLAYCPEQNLFSANNFGAFRSSGADSLTIGQNPDETTYHVYIAFVACDRSRQSNSVYLGTVTVPAKTD
jgi:hypothetical protein